LRIPPFGREIITLGDPPAESTHWTDDMMAAATAVSASAARRIWKAHGQQAHRRQHFKLSKDPQFVAKLRDVVGAPTCIPAHAIVLSVHEKSQIQAIDSSRGRLLL
jgi:hypothetical protein